MTNNKPADSVKNAQAKEDTSLAGNGKNPCDVYGDSVDKIVQGNAQPLHSKVLTRNGYTPMGEIEVGDETVTPDGTYAQVTGVYPRGERDVYTVQTVDGAQVEASDEHLWEVYICED